MARELVLTIDTCTVHLAGVPRLRIDFLLTQTWDWPWDLEASNSICR
jgi:hypothetical protein